MCLCTHACARTLARTESLAASPAAIAFSAHKVGEELSC